MSCFPELSAARNCALYYTTLYQEMLPKFLNFLYLDIQQPLSSNYPGITFVLVQGSTAPTVHGSYCSMITVPATVPWFHGSMVLLFHVFHCSYCSMVPRFHWFQCSTVPTVTWFHCSYKVPLFLQGSTRFHCSMVLLFHGSKVPLFLLFPMVRFQGSTVPWFLVPTVPCSTVPTVPWFHGSYCSMVPTLCVVKARVWL